MRMALKKIIVFLSIILLFRFISTEELRKIVFTTGEYPPYMSKKADGFGTVSKVITEACRRAKLICEYEFYPWKRAQLMVKHGKNVATFMWSKTKKRENEYIFSKYPVGYGVTTVFYKKSRFKDGVKFDNWIDLKKYRIAAVRSYWYENIYKKLEINVHYINKSKQAWKLLEIDRIDVYVDNYPVGIWDAKQVVPELMKDLGYTELEAKDVEARYSYIMFSKKYKDSAWLKNKLDLSLKSMHEDGTYRKIMSEIVDIPYN